MGMYIANRLRDETGLTLNEINERINESRYSKTFDINDSSLTAPTNMKHAVLKLLNDTPNDIDLFVSVFHSMAVGYKDAIEELETITNKKYQSIYVIGGGAKNVYLNQLIEKYTNKKVIAMPIEATALGNIKIQMKASKEL